MSSHRLKIAAATALAAGTASSNAAIVVFDFSPDFATRYFDTYGQSREVGLLNFSNGLFNDGLDSFTLYSGYTTVSFWSSNVYAGSIVNSGVTPLLLSPGGVIGASLSVDFANVLFYFDKADMPVGTHYLALRNGEDGTPVNYGWLEFVVTDGNDFSNSYNDITFTRFAFNDVAGQSILAGQTTAVPEASTLGFAGGLFGLVVAAHLRRRKAAQAAAPDSLLKLAAGEFRN